MACRGSSRFIVGAVAALALAAPSAHAQRALEVIRELRGPYQHAVVGSSTVQPDGTELPIAGATLNVPDGADLVFAKLFWMGSRTTPDTQVVLQAPGGTSSTITADAGNGDGGLECFTDADVASFNVATDDTYFACSADVTSLLGPLVRSGRYALLGLDVDTNATPEEAARYNGDALDATATADPFVDRIYAGGWALLVVYADREDQAPRVIQVARGMIAQQNTVDEIARFDRIFLSPTGGKLTHVAIEGDSFCFSGPSNGVCGAGNDEGERAVLCRGTCSPNTIVRADDNLISSATSPAGRIYGETISSEFGNVVTNVDETNGLDINTFDLSPAFTPNDRNANIFLGAGNELTVEARTGQDAVGHVLMVVELADFDEDGDGLSNLDEDANTNGALDGGETDPTKADTDGDGLCDGASSVPGVCVGGENPDRSLVHLPTETDARNPDTDGDGLCDGPGTVAGVCVGGENLSGGVVDGGESDPLRVDSDGDGLCDGPAHAIAAGPFGACSGGEDLDGGGLSSTDTDPSNADTDGDGLCDGAIDVVGVCVAGEDLDTDATRDAAETDPRTPDTDGDGLSDGVERLHGSYAGPVDGSAASGFQTDALDVDTDDDGVCDGNGTFDPAFGTCAGGEDRNLDGVTQAGQESDPTRVDTDGDGLGDGTELLIGAYPSAEVDANVARAGGQTSPVDADTDNDGLCDGSATSVLDGNGATVCTGGEDLDDDGTLDAGETDPTDDPTVLTDADADDDGVPNAFEDQNGNGLVDVGETDANDPDSDNDGLCDGAASVVGVCVGGEDLDGDGIVDPGETDPRDADSDDDGISDGTERDSAYEGTPVGSAADADATRPGRQTDPNDADSDDDGRCDGAIAVAGVCTAGEDLDGDGSLDDGETDPTDAGNTAAADCAPSDPGFPSCGSDLNVGEGEGEGALDDGTGLDDNVVDDGVLPGVISGSSLATCASTDGGGMGPFVVLALALLRCRPRARNRA